MQRRMEMNGGDSEEDARRKKVEEGNEKVWRNKAEEHGTAKE